jgi:diguanylate cyclase (GGDEF)-like protein
MSHAPSGRGPRWYPRPVDLLGEPASLASFVDQAFEGMCTWAEGAIRHPTARMAELLATGEDDLEGAALLDMVTPEYRDRVRRALARPSGSFEVELMRHDGLRAAVSLTVWHPPTESGDVRLIGLRSVQEAAPPTPATLVAAGAASRWQVALEQMDGCALTVDGAGFVVDCLLPREHPAAWSAEDAIGRPLDELLPPALAVTAQDVLGQVRSAGKPARATARLRRGTDLVAFEVLGANRAGDAAGGVSLLLVERPVAAPAPTAEDLRSQSETLHDERRGLRRELAEARHRIAALTRDLQEMRGSDRVTGLLNQRAFEDALRREWRAAIRAGTSIALLAVEIDTFARFDDHAGSQAREEALRAVATALRNQLRRPRDVAGTNGGAGFMAVMADTDEFAARARAEAVRAAVEALGVVNPDAAGQLLTVSVGGVATHPNRRSFLRDLEDGAIGQLRLARGEGGNVVSTAQVAAPWDNNALF